MDLGRKGWVGVLGGKKKTFEQRVQLNQALVTEPWGEDAPLGGACIWGVVGCGGDLGRDLREQRDLPPEGLFIEYSVRINVGSFTFMKAHQ